MHILSRLGLLLLVMMQPRLMDGEINEPEGINYYFNGSLETETLKYRYGCQLEIGTENDYDGLLIIIDKTTDIIIDTMIYETGYLETIQFMGVFADGTYGVVIERIYVETPSQMYRTYDTMVLKIDSMGTILNSIHIDHQFKGFHNHGSYLILDEIASDLPNLILDANLEMTVLPSFTAEYKSGFEYPFIGTATVNADVVAKISIYNPGNYDVIITDEDYVYQFSVIIAALVDGVIDGEIYLEPIRIIVNSQNVTLNGALFVSGAFVSEPGDYQLVIDGENGYQKKINFQIAPTVSGVIDQGVYHETVTISVSGIATLNGKRISEGEIEIDEAGDYELILWIEAKKYQTLNFEIINDSSIDTTESNGNDFPYLETILGIIVMVGLFLVLKKK
ncbi:MAG: hypothetical protein WC296_02585 [Candidatus Izemoplasmatales bacterium]|nr:hypothetical protein [Candidatus Izemoplasmatales bacterium]